MGVIIGKKEKNWEKFDGANVQVALYDCMLDKPQSGEGWTDVQLQYTRH